MVRSNAHVAMRQAPNIDTRPVDPMVLGTLQLDAPTADGKRFVSAASGLVAAGGAGWSVSDDLPQLVRMRRPGAAVSLEHGLPARADKYDLEAITAIADARGGATLLAFGSGSKKDRAFGMLQSVDGAGALIGSSRPVDLSRLYAAFDDVLPKRPNIEGAAYRMGAAGAELVLLHRGKEAGDHNTAFVLDAEQVLDAARAGRPVPAEALRSTTRIELGALRGQRLGFADARALPDGRIAFVASAEGSDSVGNGAITGSAFGILDANFAVTALRPLTGPARKVEGIELARAFDPAAPADRYLLVTDADDPSRASELLAIDV